MKISDGFVRSSLIPGYKLMDFCVAGKRLMGNITTHNQNFDSLKIIGSENGNDFEIARLSE